MSHEYYISSVYLVYTSRYSQIQTFVKLEPPLHAIYSKLLPIFFNKFATPISKFATQPLRSENNFKGDGTIFTLHRNFTQLVLNYCQHFAMNLQQFANNKCLKSTNYRQSRYKNTTYKRTHLFNFGYPILIVILNFI